MKQWEKQGGIALVTGLLFLLVVTIIAVTAASNSALGVKMSANMQDSYRSFQSAEAGVYAVLGLAGTGQDPFQRDDEDLTPFAGVDADDHPFRNQASHANIERYVGVYLIASERLCPRPPSGRGGNGVGVVDCDYYRVESEHIESGRARTQVELGVVKTVIGH